MRRMICGSVPGEPKRPIVQFLRFNHSIQGGTFSNYFVNLKHSFLLLCRIYRLFLLRQKELMEKVIVLELARFSHYVLLSLNRKIRINRRRLYSVISISSTPFKLLALLRKLRKYYSRAKAEKWYKLEGTYYYISSYCLISYI